MNDCESYGCKVSDVSNYGYWTSTAAYGTYSTSVWYVGRYGKINATNANSDSSNGIRPVIEVSKSNL